MKLVWNWKAVVLRAWSFRLSVIAALLTGAEVAIEILMDEPPIPRGWFAAIGALVSVSSAIARPFAQVDVSGSGGKP